jgi:3',5'-cyclic AMP phosphodiesterase CpdA
MAILSNRRSRGLLAAALLLGALLLYGAERDKAYVAGPYLANPGPGRISIRGITREPCRWSVVPLSPDSPHAEEREPTRIHRVDLTSLPKNGIAQIQVLADGAPVEGGRLAFPTEPEGAAPFTFAVVGDSGGYPARLAELWGYTPHEGAKHRPEVIVHGMSEARPQLILHAGDVVYPDGERENYVRAFFRPYAPLIATTPIAAAIGNHDLKTAGGAPFLEVFGEAAHPPLSEGKYYSFEYGPLHVAVLDSNEEDFDLLEPQRNWLREDLKRATRPWKVALCHVPLRESSPVRRAAISERQRQLSEALWKECADGGVSVVFNGHNHWYERSQVVDGMVQITSGGGGDDLKPFLPGDFAMAASYFHFVRLRIEGDTMNLQAYRDSGAEIEAPGGVMIARRR